MGSVGENKAPKFVKKPQLRQEDDGNRLIFECELSGNPQPEVHWFRQDEKMVEDDRTSFRSTETQVGTYMVVLELNDVIEADAGLYKVKAKNKFGEVSASINLNFSREFHCHYCNHFIKPNLILFSFSCRRTLTTVSEIGLNSVSNVIFNIIFRQVDGSAPTFVTKPTVRQSDEDSTTLIFHSTIFGDPLPNLSWYHGGDKVNNNSKFEVKTWSFNGTGS